MGSLFSKQDDKQLEEPENVRKSKENKASQPQPHLPGDQGSGDADKAINTTSVYFEEISTPEVEPTNKALDKVKAGLYSVKVSRYDANQVQREIEGELFDKWNERCEVMEAKRIAIENIQNFLDHLEDAYEGIDEEMRKKMNGIQWSEEWAYKIMEFKYNASSDSGARYGMIAFGKSKDGKFVDCMYCLYKLDFKVAPEHIVTVKEKSILWGLKKWQTVEETTRERVLGVTTLKRIKNFFRFKALKGFYDEGLIDEINVVPSIEDASDEKDTEQ